jgi:hypothetical protein
MPASDGPHVGHGSDPVWAGLISGGGLAECAAKGGSVDDGAVETASMVLEALIGDSSLLSGSSIKFLLIEDCPDEQ